MAPQTQKQWTVKRSSGFEGLELNKEAKVAAYGDNEVLVKCKLLHSMIIHILMISVHAASLNFRDLIIAKVRHLFPQFLRSLTRSGQVPFRPT